MNSLRVILSISIMLIVMSPSIILSRTSSLNSHITVPGDYSSIQTAIDNAEEGSTILVSPGTYVEDIRINKRLTIIGSGNSTVIENNGASKTIEIPRGVNGAAVADLFVNASSVSSTGIHVGDARTRTGIYVGGEDCNLQNITVANHETGIWIYDSSRDFLRNNRMIDNRYNLEVWGLSLFHFLHDIDASNLVDGRKVCYWVNEQDKIVPSDAGYVAIVNSTRITIKDVNLTRNYSGILLAYTTDSLVLNATCSNNEEGILFFLSNNNTVVGSRFDSNEWIGVSFCSSSKNYVAGNTISSNGNFGMYLYYSSLIPERSDDNNVCGNVLTHNLWYGFYFDGSSRNHVCSNEINDNKIGVCLDSSSQNLFADNYFSKNAECGVKIDGSTDNDFHHDIFVGNNVQVRYVEHIGLPVPLNRWDNDYPSGGNFWSDYNSTDYRGGYYQNETGSDGIGDSAYVINSNNQDHYPLFAPPEKNTQLNVSFSYYPNEPKLFDMVSFVDDTTSSSGIALRLWVFSDNQILRSQNVSKLFVQSQNYTVILYAINNEGTTEFAERTFQVRRIFSTLTLAINNENVLLDEIPIKARLVDENSKAMPNATINFYIIRGLSKEWIGASETNSTGDATTFHSFNETGLLTIYAEYLGDQWFTPSNCTLSAEIVYSENLTPTLIGIALSSTGIVALLFLYTWRRKRRSQSVISKDTVALH